MIEAFLNNEIEVSCRSEKEAVNFIRFMDESGCDLSSVYDIEDVDLYFAEEYMDHPDGVTFFCYPNDEYYGISTYVKSYVNRYLGNGCYTGCESHGRMMALRSVSFDEFVCAAGVADDDIVDLDSISVDELFGWTSGGDKIGF